MNGRQPDTGCDVKRPTVHYPSSVAINPSRISISDDEPLSKAPSMNGTDEEDYHEHDYDWSADEDLADEEANFDQKMPGEKLNQGCSPKRIATFFFSTLIGSTLLAGLIVTVPVLLHFYYRPHPSEWRRYITENVSAWLYWAAANILLSWYLAMIVDIIPILISAIIVLAWGEVNETVRGRVELYNAAKDKIKPVLYGASGWASWIVTFDGIYHLYDRNDESHSRAQYTLRTYQAIKFFFFFTLASSAERILFHMTAFAFHRKAFDERIVTLKHNLKVIDHLRNYRPKRHTPRHSAHRPLFTFAGLTHTPGTGSRSAMFDALSDDDGHAGDVEDRSRHKGQCSKKDKQRRSWIFSTPPPTTPPSGQSTTVFEGAPDAPADQPYQHHSTHTYPPTTPPEQTSGPKPGRTTVHSGRSTEEPVMVFQAAKVLKTAVLHDARNITGTEDNSGTLGWSVNSAREAKRLARSIYTAFKVDRRRDYLIPSDFYPAYVKQEDAEKAFKVFDKDNNGDISRSEIKSVIIKLYRERRALSRSLRDVDNALKTLNWIMMFFAMIILFFVSLSVFHVAIGNSLTSFYTIGIAASFIFKNSASSAFDAVMFIFVTHPFDTGDRCFIDDENLVVKKMGLFATTFLRADGTETYYFNSQLFTKFITNVQRSGKMFENMTVQVAWRTPMEKLDQLEERMNEWLATEENRWFEPTTTVTLQRIDYQRSLEFTMSIGHNGYEFRSLNVAFPPEPEAVFRTWQDWGLRNTRKTAFAAAVHHYCRQLGISFHESPLPVFLAENQEDVGMQFLDGNESIRSASPGLSEVDAASVPGKERIREPLLGFKPPQENRTTLRARKSKVRKGTLRGMGEGGGDAS